MKKTLFMVTTPDEYELPLCVGTAGEVARFLGIQENSVRVSVTPGRAEKKKSHRNKRFRLYRVEVDEDDEQQG